MQIKRKGLTLKIYEGFYEDPREYYKDTNIGKMICWHKRYTLGDEHNFDTPRDFQRWIKENERRIACILPVYLLDHSGLHISTHDFLDPWDSGQVGYIYCTKNTLRERELSSPEGYERAKELLQEEVEEYDKWLSGDPPYYGFEITDENDNTIDCQGIFDGSNFKSMIKEMKERSEHKYDFLFNALQKQEESASYL